MPDENIDPRTVAVDVTSSAPNMWVWFATLDVEGAPLAYGCAAPTLRAPWLPPPAALSYVGTNKLRVYEAVVDSTIGERFLMTLKSGTIDVSLLPEGPALAWPVLANRRVNGQSALGQSQLAVTVAYTSLDGDSALLNPSILTWLEAQHGMPFTGQYAGRTGAFDIFSPQFWLDGPVPFQLQRQLLTPAPGQSALVVIRASEHVDRSCFVRIRATNHLSEVLADRLMPMSSGQSVSAPVYVDETLTRTQFEVFDDQGALVHRDECAWLRQINISMQIHERQVNIQDDLSRSASAQGLGARAREVHSKLTSRNTIRPRRSPSATNYEEHAREKAAIAVPTPSADRWFGRGINNQLAVIEYLRQELNGSRIRRALIVDPFFGADALSRLVLRLDDRSVHVTIMTSWGIWHPDTGKRTAEVDNRQRLESLLNQASQVINPELHVVNVLRGQESAFHDRYIVLYPHEGAPQVHMLSNSINNLAVNWPLCVARLEPDVAADVVKYVTGLIAGWDHVMNAELDINMEWGVRYAGI
ncbi:VPA1262 family N-terminal domain-containing protein [Burkholderia ambifaria]|uniref:VPA1262 family N-terminal domain-containing protein n=1 Tax=Burkholderia ambifaria TaxID=152480 RepID=UPI0015885C9C|nr:VPA1262 family N-terminal domain-containing protein [Burkholderia ambifaria]